MFDRGFCVHKYMRACWRARAHLSLYVCLQKCVCSWVCIFVFWTSARLHVHVLVCTHVCTCKASIGKDPAHKHVHTQAHTKGHSYEEMGHEFSTYCLMVGMCACECMTHSMHMHGHKCDKICVVLLHSITQDHAQHVFVCTHPSDRVHGVCLCARGCVHMYVCSRACEWCMRKCS